MHPNHLCVEPRCRTLNCLPISKACRSDFVAELSRILFFRRSSAAPLRPNTSPVRPQKNVFSNAFAKNDIVGESHIQECAYAVCVCHPKNPYQHLPDFRRPAPKRHLQRTRNQPSTKYKTCVRSPGTPPLHPRAHPTQQWQNPSLEPCGRSRRPTWNLLEQTLGRKPGTPSRAARAHCPRSRPWHTRIPTTPPKPNQGQPPSSFGRHSLPWTTSKHLESCSSTAPAHGATTCSACCHQPSPDSTPKTTTSPSYRASPPFSTQPTCRPPQWL